MSKNKKFTYLSMIFCFIAFSSAMAQENQNQPRKDTFGMYLSIGKLTIDSDTAFLEGIDDSAHYVRLAVEGRKKHLAYGLGISGYLYSDNQDFSQRVEDNFGNQYDADSQADSFNLFLEGGWGFDMSPRLEGKLMGGVEMILQSSRGIASCSNCSSDDIDIDSGFYVAPRIQLKVGQRYWLSAIYHQYINVDVEKGFSISFGMSM